MSKNETDNEKSQDSALTGNGTRKNEPKIVVNTSVNQEKTKCKGL